LRAGGADLPVVIITARDAVADRIAGLDRRRRRPSQALRSRRARRAHPAWWRGASGTRAEIEYGSLRLDPAKRSALVDGQEVALSGREFALLEALLERPGAVLSRAQLEERIYGWQEEIESNAVEVHIHALRRKLGADLIRTLRGVGYTMGRRP
jgi:two-component system response regulator QseB